MQKISNPRIVCFDVDETLVYWGANEEKPHLFVKDLNGAERRMPYNDKAAEKMMSFKQAGYFVIVWSQSGEEWANNVLEALGVAEYVDLVSSKPMFYVDDLDANAWMRRINPEDFK